MTDSEDENLTEAEKREIARQAAIESDLQHAADLFGDVGISNSGDIFAGVGIPAGRKAKTAANAVVLDESDPTSTVDLEKLPLFKPQTKKQFDQMKDTLVPLVKGNNSAKPHYALFLEDFARQLAMDMSSEQIKKLASKLTALGNEKQKEEKEAAKGGKKTKAQKSKVTLTASRNVASGKDTSAYDDADDFGE